MYALYAILLSYTAYIFLWTRFGLGVTSVIQYALLCLVLLGILMYFVTPLSGKNSFVNWLIVLWITQFVAFFFSNSTATTQFKEATFILLVVVPFVSQIYNPKQCKYVILLMSIISVAMFFVTMSILLEENENSYGGGYLPLVALPVLLYFMRRQSIRNQMLCSCVILVIVLMSMKRGDILACVLAIIVYYAMILRETNKVDVRILFVFCFIAFIGYLTFDYLLQNSPIFAWKVQQTIDGDSSGRDEIYTKIWQHFLNSPFDIQLCGGGFDASVKIAGNRAHSDWLEVLSGEGLLGVFVYFCAYISLFRHMCRRKNIAEKAVLASILVIWLVKSIFSMFIFSQPTIILFVLTGYILNKRIDKQYEY